MNTLYIFDPTKSDSLSQFRGGGRFIQILKESLPEAKYISNLKESFARLEHGRTKMHQDPIFINPIFNPFRIPATLKRLAKKQIQFIFDVIPLKYSDHFPIGLKGKFNLWLNKLALKNYDKIITISNHSKKDIVQYLKIPESKIEVVYPTLSKIFISNVILNSFQDLKKMPKQVRHDNVVIKQYNNIITPQNFCLYAGDVNWNKNLVNLARAIKIINVTCVFVGKPFQTVAEKPARLDQKNLRGLTSLIKIRTSQVNDINSEEKPAVVNHSWLKEFRDFLTEVGDDKRFIFLGYVDDYKLIKLYQQARVNILVSRDEGFGLSFLEATSQSCPSVLSDIEVFHEAAADSAWFANPEDPHDIANKIGEIYFNNDLRDKLGKKAKERINNFSSIKFRKDFLKALE